MTNLFQHFPFPLLLIQHNNKEYNFISTSNTRSLQKTRCFWSCLLFLSTKNAKGKKRKAWQPPLGSHPAKRERIIKKYFNCWRGHDVSSKANSRWYKAWLSPSISWTNLTQKVPGGGGSGSYGTHGSAQFIAFRCAHFRLFDYVWNLFDDWLYWEM